MWKDYLEILKKNIRIEKHLSSSKKTVLLIDELTKLLFAPVAIATTVMIFNAWPLIAALLFIMFTKRLFIIKIAQNRLNERKIFIPSLVYDLFVPYFKLFYRWYFNSRSQNRNGK